VPSQFRNQGGYLTATLPSLDLKVPPVYVARRRLKMLLYADKLVLRLIAQTATSTKQDVAEIVKQARPLVAGLPRALLLDLIQTALGKRYDEEAQAHLAAAQRLFRKEVFDSHFSNDQTPDMSAVELLDEAMKIGLLSPRLSEWPSKISLVLYPRAAAHVICGSLGYATADHSARIVANAHDREGDFCEWIDSCAQTKPGQTYRTAMAVATHDVVKHSLSNAPYQTPRRKRHSGYMSDYTKARVIVIRELIGKTPPGTLAAWF